MTTTRTEPARDERKTVHLKQPHGHKPLDPFFGPSFTSISKPSERSVMDVVERLESADKELEAFISRRADKTPDPDTTEPSYAESVRRFHVRRREAHKWEWVRYFDRLARNHARLAQENEARAAALIEEVG